MVHATTIHQVELNPMRSVRRRGSGRSWYQRRRPDEGMCARRDTVDYRSDRNPARSSEAYSSGCSHAAKCPPWSTWL